MFDFFQNYKKLVGMAFVFCGAIIFLALEDYLDR